MDELFNAIKSFVDSGWSMVSVVVVCFSAIAWVFKFLNNRLKRSKLENKEYLKSRLALRDVMPAISDEQFMVAHRELTEYFYDLMKSIEDEFYELKGKEGDFLFVSRKSDKRGHVPVNMFKRAFYDETEKVYKRLANDARQDYVDFRFSEAYTKALESTESSESNSYYEKLRSRSIVCTSALRNQVKMQTWNHEVVEKSIAEIISIENTEKILHEIYKTYHEREEQIEYDMAEIESGDLIKGK